MPTDFDASSTYDLVPYKSFPYVDSQPRKMAAIATLFGIPIPDVSRCRVLEVGCASGGNLVPLAACFPNSEFVGIDASQRQIKSGQQVIDDLNLTNIQLERQDILEFDGGSEAFDFIICHGVFSWVPRPVQEQILSICRDCLSSQGIAYISYNTYPGWYLRRGVREMMKYHAAGFDTTQEKIDQSRALLNFLTRAVASEDGAYESLLRSEVDIISESDDSYLYHEHLEERNEPLFFHQFVEWAEKYSLRFLSEASFSSMLPHELPEDTQRTLQLIAPDIVRMEQYVDFIRNRRFRQSLLCSQQTSLNRAIDPERVMSLFVASSLKEINADDAEPDVVSVWEHRRGQRITIHATAQHLAFTRLAELWPQEIAFLDLVEQTYKALSPADGDDLAELSIDLAGTILECYSAGLIDLFSAPSLANRNVGTRPLAFPLARYMAARSENVTNCRHQTVALNVIDRWLIQRLDGNRTIHDLAQAVLDSEVRDEFLSVEEPMPEEAVLSPAEMESPVQSSLRRLANAALLIG